MLKFSLLLSQLSQFGIRYIRVRGDFGVSSSSICISLNLLTAGSHTIVSLVFGLSEVKQPNNRLPHSVALHTIPVHIYSTILNTCHNGAIYCDGTTYFSMQWVHTGKTHGNVLLTLDH